MQLFSTLDARARCFWSKSGEPSGHTLLAHMLDVAAVAEVLLEYEPGQTRFWAAQVFGIAPAQITRWLAALVGLHDYGKAIPGFQSKWCLGKARCEKLGLCFSNREISVTDHSCATEALLRAEFAWIKVQSADRWIRGVLQAISAHHGYNFLSSEVAKGKPLCEGAAWSESRKALLKSYWDALAPEGRPVADELSTAAIEWLAGLTSVSDWIGSNVDWFPYQERGSSLAGHFECAKDLAREALASLGWSPHGALLQGSQSTDELIGRILQSEGAMKARPLQDEGDRLLADVAGPALVIVEAPMGEGKTELALLAHLRLQLANQHRGLYLALPTQATGNALFDRVLPFLKEFAEGARLDVQLVHGGARFNDRIQYLRDVYGAPGEEVTSSAWFSQRRRPLLSPYGVGTVDQALFATLNVKHHFVRIWGLANRVVVFDEIHAYDTYTTGLIESLLRWLKSLGSSVVLMSATLPERRRRALVSAWGMEADALPELPYPRLLVADSRGVNGTSFAARALAPIRVEAIDEDIDSLAGCAAALLQHDGCGVVIVNTVDRAQALYQLLRGNLEESVEILLFHARFPADERSERERDVLARFGRDGERPRRALLIATQVAEQSLDIDFDFMLTDLAPIDLILQRAGRLHRHELSRPEAHKEARLFVAGLHPERLPELTQTRWEFVYEPYILGRTWALLSRESTLVLPQDIDRLVQAVYGDADLPTDLDEQAYRFIMEEAYGQHLARQDNERQRSGNIAVNPAQEPQNAYLQKPRGNEEGDGLGLTNRTRLGDDAVSLIPVHVVDGGWAVTFEGPAFDPGRQIGDELAKALYGRQLKLSRVGVVRHYKEQEAPVAFAQHPLLRHLKPLLLENGQSRIGTLRLCLDAELGLVYEKTKSPMSEETS